MKSNIVRISLLSILALGVLGCSEDQVMEPQEENQNNEIIYITDRTGKKWDVTHAVNQYGMTADNFDHGLGPFAIRPINSPEFLMPGQPGYPAIDSDEVVLGVEIQGDARAYPIAALISHEVVNDQVGASFISPVY